MVKWKLLSHVRLFVTPWAVQSMEFSRPEYWSGLPCLPPGDPPNLGIKPRSPTLQADSLPSEPPGTPKNTGLGSLALLQGIFPTQESNQGLLHFRQIIYQLSYQGSLLEIKDHIIFPYIFSWDLAHWTMFYYKICYIFSWYQVSTIKKIKQVN